MFNLDQQQVRRNCDDPKEARDYVREGLAIFSRALLLVRYEANGKPLIYVPTWDKHQRVDRPNKPRHPRPADDWTPPPTSGNDPPESHLREVSRDPREDVATGAVEQWSSGAVEEHTSAAADGGFELALLPEPVDHDAEFETWWAPWPHKTAKVAAKKAYRSARKKLPAERLYAIAADHIAVWEFQQRPKSKIPHAATWLNGERWNDEIERPRGKRNGNPESPWHGVVIEEDESVWAEDLGRTS